MPFEPLDFSTRAHLQEWMDEPCTYEDFRDCLRDLAQVNTVSFGHAPTLRWLEAAAATGGPIHIVDVGCGGGDLLRAVERWARRRKLEVSLTGIDLNPFAARAAQEFTAPGSAIRWVTGDAFSYQPELPIDIVVSSLFTHHLPDAEIVRFIQWMERVAARGWFINDLHRHPVPYHAFRALAWAARWHRFVQHDGPVSFRRAFTVRDWQAYCAAAGLHPEDVRIRAAGVPRLCVARLKQ